MIPWENLDARLTSIGKDRTWLAKETPYSLESIRNAMAPASQRRSERMLLVLSRAIEDEEERQAGQRSREIRPGVFEIFQTEEQLHAADLASRIVGAPSLSEFCRDVILVESKRLIRDASLETGEDGLNVAPFPDAGPASGGGSSPGASRENGTEG